MDADRLRLTLATPTESYVQVLFTEEVVERGLTHFRDARWQSGSATGDVPARASRSGEGASEHLIELDRGLGLLQVTFGWVYATAAAASQEDARAALEQLRSLRPPREERDEQVVPVTFWSAGMHGPMPIQRELEIPSWEEIADNYAPETRAELDRLVDPDFRPGRGGQLLLWHGETGTGKTTALRALAYAWREWCGIHYITDPEKFFGEHADYMLTVMVQHQLDDDFDADDDALDSFDAPAPLIAMHIAPGMPVRTPRVPPWRLLVLEDAGELLAADARAVAGQALSRFLNAVDGLIGQGLRFLVLVTTNEAVGKLHPAVARAGRAASRIAFRPLTESEAREWLRERGGDPGGVSGPQTLASLYARLEGLAEIPASRPLGF